MRIFKPVVMKSCVSKLIFWKNLIKERLNRKVQNACWDKNEVSKQLLSKNTVENNVNRNYRI